MGFENSKEDSNECSWMRTMRKGLLLPNKRPLANRSLALAGFFRKTIGNFKVETHSITFKNLMSKLTSLSENCKYIHVLCTELGGGHQEAKNPLL